MSSAKPSPGTTSWSTMEHIAGSGPHWELTTYGETSEGRPLLGLIMSSPENMVRLDELKAEKRRCGTKAWTVGIEWFGCT